MVLFGRCSSFPLNLARWAEFPGDIRNGIRSIESKEMKKKKKLHVRKFPFRNILLRILV